MNKNKNNQNSKKDEQAINAYKPNFNDIKSDVNGSYTGIPENNEVPEQDADDL